MGKNTDLPGAAALAMVRGVMTWHVQYRDESAEHLAAYNSPGLAIDAACHLIDEGFDVYGIGTGPLTYSVGKPEIDRIYALWTRTKAGAPGL